MLNVVVLACIALGDPRPPPVARVEVLEGRVSWATSAGVIEVRGPQRAQAVLGTVYVEIAPLARVHVGWDASASVEVVGPAKLEWSRADTTEHALTLRVIDCAQLNLEVRRDKFVLELPGGRRADIERGAICVRSVARGTIELFHDAGLPLLLSTQSAQHIIWPPVTLLPGARLRLEAGCVQPIAVAGSERRVLDHYGRSERAAWEHARPSQPWARFSWPWSAPTNSAPSSVR